jgi:hypothetical protein
VRDVQIQSSAQVGAILQNEVTQMAKKKLKAGKRLEETKPLKRK